EPIGHVGLDLLLHRETLGDEREGLKVLFDAVGRVVAELGRDIARRDGLVPLQILRFPSVTMEPEAIDGGLVLIRRDNEVEIRSAAQFRKEGMSRVFELAVMM